MFLFRFSGISCLTISSDTLPGELKKAVLEYLKSIDSTRVICEILIKKHNAPVNRYNTNKPKIYPQAFLEEKWKY
ncbi:DUF3895 domain-containing protein [Peribacillus butanolivorans]